MIVLRLAVAGVALLCASLAGYLAAGVWVSADPIGFEMAEAES